MLKATVAAAILSFVITAPGAADSPWDGFYGGAQLSYSHAKTAIVGNRFTYNQNQSVNAVNHDYRGAGLAGFVGWNRQRGNVVLGGEFSLGLSDLESNLVFNADNDIDDVKIGVTGSVTGRAGYAFGNTMTYLRGGLAFADINNVGGDVNSGVLQESDAHRRDRIRFGATVGVGAERFISEQWLGRIEINYTEFKSYEEANDDGAAGSQVYSIDNGPIRSISLGLVRKF